VTGIADIGESEEVLHSKEVLRGEAAGCRVTVTSKSHRGKSGGGGSGLGETNRTNRVERRSANRPGSTNLARSRDGFAGHAVTDDTEPRAVHHGSW
jgi:hypothetical protein